MKQYKQEEAVQQTPMPPSYSDRQFLHNFQVGVVIPLAQSLVNAVMGVLLVGTLLFLKDAIDYVKPMIATFVFVLVGSWLYLQRRWFTLTALEKHVNLDLNHDGYIGEEDIPRVHIQIDSIQENGNIRQEKMFTLPCSEEELQAIAEGVRNGIPFSEKEWTGAGKPFSTNRFREIRGEMLKRGMLAPSSSKSHKQGYTWTKSGEAVINHYSPSEP